MKCLISNIEPSQIEYFSSGSGLMPMSQLWNACVRTTAKYMENRVGVGISSCFTPLSKEISSDSDPLEVTGDSM